MRRLRILGGSGVRGMSARFPASLLTSLRILPGDPAVRRIPFEFCL